VPAGGGKSSKAPLFIILGLVALVFLAIVAGAVLLLVGGDDGDDEDARATTTTEADDDRTTTTEDDETTTTEDDDEPSSSGLPDAETPPSFDDAAFDALGATCEEGDLVACDVLFAITPVGSDAEAYGATCGGRNEEIPGQCAGEYEWDLPAAQAPGDLGDNATFDALASDCESGDLVACDDLYGQTPAGSDYEAYGRTCGGRLPVAAADQISGFQCESRYSEASGSTPLGGGST
jgi:hypothetical protein